jgi:hypothetical protein
MSSCDFDSSRGMRREEAAIPLMHSTAPCSSPCRIHEAACPRSEPPGLPSFVITCENKRVENGRTLLSYAGIAF